MYDCKYCVNRRTNETRRATFTPEELADLTIQFYRNYIEGLFLSSGVLRSPDYTTELMIRALSILRREYRFNGYIHAKAIPGASPELVEQLGMLADRLSVNIEFCRAKRRCAPSRRTRQKPPCCGLCASSRTADRKTGASWSNTVTRRALPLRGRPRR